MRQVIQRILKGKTSRSINIDDVLAKLKKLERKTWKPVVQPGDGPLTASKFAGKPWLSQEEQWPACPNCHKPMQFFVQLNLDQLPQELAGKFGSGLLQMFYCTGENPYCESNCGAFFPFSPSELLRIVQIDGQPFDKAHDAARDVEIPAIENLFPPKTIIDWEETTDNPSWQELDELGVNLSDDESNMLYELGIEPKSGDKLAGWPLWIQGVEYPNCPVCQAEMSLVFQIDSEDNIPYMFGDVGCGHITQCRKHKEQLAFAWACH